MNPYMHITWFIFAPILCLFYLANGNKRETITQRQGKAPSRPFFLIPQLVKGDPSKVNLTWQPPRYPHGRLIGYEIYYTDNPRQADSRWYSIGSVYRNNQLPTRMLVDNLQPSTVYYFKVRAQNTQRAGGFSDIADIKTGPEEKECSWPGELHNGVIIGHRTSVGAMIIFECDPGTTLSGQSNVSTCQENGEWSYPLPDCLEKTANKKVKSDKRVLEESPAEIIEKGFKTTFPSLTDSQPHQVNVSLSLVNIASARLNRNEVEINTWITLTWQYPGLEWDLKKQLGHKKYWPEYDEYWMDHFTLSPSQLWIPDVVPLSLSRPLEPLTPSLLRVNHTGHVTWRVNYRMYINCAVGARRSSCGLRIGSLTHGEGVMALYPVKGDIELSQYFKDSKYKVLKSSLKVRDGAIDGTFTFRKA